MSSSRWARGKFGDLVQIKNGYAFKSKDFRDDGDVLLVRQSNLASSTVTKKNGKYLPTVYLDQHKDFIVQKGDILIGLSGSIGKYCTYSLDEPALLNQRVGKFVFRHASTARYALYLYQHLINDVLARTRGVGIQNISSKDIESLDALVPSQAEQEEIVAKIEELFSEIDNASSATTTAYGRFKAYEQATVDTLFSEYELGAELGSFGDIADIKGGITKGRKIKGTAIGEMPYLRVANVQDGYLYLDEIKTISITEDELQKYSLASGDILFTEGGDKDKLGRGTIWRGEIEPCIHQNHIFRARVDTEDFLPEYISYATKTTRARDFFFAKAKQTTNLASLNMTSLKSLQLPVIPIAQQRELVDSISAKLSEIRAAKKELIVMHHRAESLKQSILSKAFKGELV